jgi:hypothetical protein
MRRAVPTLKVEEVRLIGEVPGQAPSLATMLAQVKAATGLDPSRWLDPSAGTTPRDAQHSE